MTTNKVIYYAWDKYEQEPVVLIKDFSERTLTSYRMYNAASFYAVQPDVKLSIKTINMNESNLDELEKRYKNLIELN